MSVWWDTDNLVKWAHINYEYPIQLYMNTAIWTQNMVYSNAWLGS